MAWLTATILCFVVCKVVCTWPTVYMGNDPILRASHDDSPPAASPHHPTMAIIPEPGKPITHMGEISRFSFYVYDDPMRIHYSNITLQIWRRSNSSSGGNATYKIVNYSASPLRTTPGLNVRRVNPFQVMPGDVWGFSYGDGNPISYDETPPESCRDQDRVLTTSTPTEFEWRTLHNFTVGSSCRVYSMHIDIDYYNCIEIYASSSLQSIQSRNYPNNYPNKLDECWMLVNPYVYDQKAIRLWTEDFSTDGCSDYAEVYNVAGNKDPEQLITYMCGDNSYNFTADRGRNMLIFFHTDIFMTRKGFNMTFQLQEDELKCEIDLATSYPKFLTTPLFPDTNYPGSKDRCWIIEASAGGLLLEVLQTSMQPEVNGSGCIYDSMEVRDGSSSKSPVVWRWCGSTIPGNTSTAGGAFYIRFRSDNLFEGTAVQLMYQLNYTDLGTSSASINDIPVYTSGFLVPLLTYLLC